jgi:hypothetical protein
MLDLPARQAPVAGLSPSGDPALNLRDAGTKASRRVVVALRWWRQVLPALTWPDEPGEIMSWA